jgi:hypothetical protein
MVAHGSGVVSVVTGCWVVGVNKLASVGCERSHCVVGSSHRFSVIKDSASVTTHQQINVLDIGVFCRKERERGERVKVEFI